MSLEVVKKYTPAEADKKRQKVLETRFGPAVKKVFDKYPNLQSAVLMIAQYWCDEAYDGIEIELPFSTKLSPDIESWLNYMDDDLEEEFWQSKPSFIEGKKGALEAKVSFDASGVSDIFTVLRDVLNDPEGKYIPIFSAFCKEGGNQGASYSNNYTSYAIFRRASAEADIEIEIVGEMLRPWLDGVMPLVEQEEKDFPETVAYAEGLKRTAGVTEPIKTKVSFLERVQNSMDPLIGPDPNDQEPVAPMTEFEALKLVMKLLGLVFLVMLAFTLMGGS